ncbi:MAG: D-Ala-D-Ala carboxypeptidase family metallohydrolase [Flavobacteriales bacterium]
MKRWPTPDMRYFDISEFDSPDEPGSGQYMDDEFLEMLDNARHLAGIPFIINSGYRTKAANQNAGGLRNSAHLDGFAADISANQEPIRAILHKLKSQVQTIGAADAHAMMSAHEQTIKGGGQISQAELDTTCDLLSTLIQNLQDLLK